VRGQVDEDYRLDEIEDRLNDKLKKAKVDNSLLKKDKVPLVDYYKAWDKVDIDEELKESDKRSVSNVVKEAFDENKGKEKNKKVEKVTKINEMEIKRLEKERVGLFFEHNMQLGPPYHIIIDTNFINFSIQNKLDIFKASMDCLLGKCIPYITDCVVAEL
jgi:rRNA-processing protein FCF1